MGWATISLSWSDWHQDLFPSAPQPPPEGDSGGLSGGVSQGLGLTHLTQGVDGLHSRGDASRHPPARDWYEDNVQVRNLVQQLQPDGSLARHHVIVIIRVDDDPLGLLRNLIRRLPSAGRGGLAQH